MVLQVERRRQALVVKGRGLPHARRRFSFFIGPARWHESTWRFLRFVRCQQPDRATFEGLQRDIGGCFPRNPRFYHLIGPSTFLHRVFYPSPARPSSGLLCTFRTCRRRKLVCQSRLLVSASQVLRLERGAPHNVEANGRRRIRLYHHRISCQHAIKRRPESAVSLIVKKRGVAVRLALWLFVGLFVMPTPEPLRVSTSALAWAAWSPRHGPHQAGLLNAGQFS